MTTSVQQTESRKSVLKEVKTPSIGNRFSPLKLCLIAHRVVGGGGGKLFQFRLQLLMHGHLNVCLLVYCVLILVVDKTSIIIIISKVQPPTSR